MLWSRYQSKTRNTKRAEYSYISVPILFKSVHKYNKDKRAVSWKNRDGTRDIDFYAVFMLNTCYLTTICKNPAWNLPARPQSGSQELYKKSVSWWGFKLRFHLRGAVAGRIRHGDRWRLPPAVVRFHHGWSAAGPSRNRRDSSPSYTFN